MNSKITYHAKQRLSERTNLRKNRNSFAKIVNKNGKTKNYYRGSFYKYLCNKEKNRSKTKVYQDNIYVFTKASKKLITTYPVPEKYLPVADYEISKELIALSSKTRDFLNRKVQIICKDNSVIEAVILKEFYPQFNTNITALVKDEIELIPMSEVNDIVNINKAKD